MKLSIILFSLAPGAFRSDSIVLEGATVHTMVPGERARVTAVWVENGRVKALGEDLELPPGTVRIDLSGLHLVPALIDSYVNFDPDHDALYTAAGIGLVRDIGGNRARLLSERAEEKRKLSLGPDLLTAGAALDGDPPSTPEAVVLRDPEMAERLLVEYVVKDGVDFLSILPGLSKEVWMRVIEVAHQNELEVWGPVPRGLTLAETLAAGQDGIHFLDTLLPSGVDWDEVSTSGLEAGVEALARSKTPVVPMLSASARRLQDQSDDPRYARLFQLLAPAYESWWKNELQLRLATLTPEIHAQGERALAKQREALHRLHQAGVPLLAGSGAPQPWLLPGAALHEELAAWQASGIPSEEVLRLATRGTAEHLGLAGEYGSIEPGARAQLLVLRRDPRQDIQSLIDLEQVLVRGSVLERDELEGLLKKSAEKYAALREALAAPITVEPPPLPPEGVPILEGLVETRALGQRVSAERFRVVRLEGERVAFMGHVVFPRIGEESQRDMLVSQVTDRGELASIAIAFRDGERMLRHEGIWSGGSWRMRRVLDDQPLDLLTTREHPVAVDVGSVTLHLLLGQAPFSERFPVIVFHEGLEPESVMWSMEADDRGNHQVRTHLGRKAFRFNEFGALEKALTAVGESRVETVLLESSALGGAGLVLPAEKRAALEARSLPAPVSEENEEGG